MQAKYRHALPQMGDKLFLTDGGIETTLIFHDGLELPHFAAFDLLAHRRGPRRRSRATTRPTWRSPRRDGRGLVLESATWRSNPDWGARLGYSPEALDAVNAEAIELHPRDPRRRGDAREPDGAERLRRAARRRLRAGQLHDRGRGRGLPRAADRVFEAAGADLVTAITMTYVEEGDRRRAGGEGGGDAGGRSRSRSRPTAACARACRSATAIEACDAATGGYPAYYMVNCAHPTHFRDVLAAATGWSGSAGSGPTPRR